MILDLYEALLRIESGSTYRTPAQVLLLLPCAEGKTQPVSYYASKYLARKDSIMSEVVEYPVDDPEYMTPQQAQAMRELDRLRNAKAQVPQPAPLPDSWPADVEQHRLLNDTVGEESEA